MGCTRASPTPTAQCNLAIIYKQFQTTEGTFQPVSLLLSFTSEDTMRQTLYDYTRLEVDHTDVQDSAHRGPGIMNRRTSLALSSLRCHDNYFR